MGVISPSVRYVLGALLKGKWSVCGGKVFRNQLCRNSRGLCRAGAGEVMTSCLASPCPALPLPPPLLLSGEVSGGVSGSEKGQGKCLGYLFFLKM